MSKLLAVAAGLKGIFVAATFAFVRGDMLPVILISVVFNLVQLSTKSGQQAMARDSVVLSRSHDEGR
jgi:hypothetical protein